MGGVEELKDIKSILNNKMANVEGITRMLLLSFGQWDIPTQLVLTCDRTKFKFDKDFESFSFLQNYIIYFTNLDTYLSPEAADLRYGYILPENTLNYGLFIKPVEIGDLKTGIGTVQMIPEPDYKDTYSYIDLQADLTDLTEPKFHLITDHGGYYARAYQARYEFWQEEVQEEVRKALIEYVSGETPLENLEVQNANAIDFGVKPFRVSADFTSLDFLEKAGPNYLFKIGELIGPQMEMYTEETSERRQNIEANYGRVYHRELNFTIPTDYEIANADSAVFNFVHVEENDQGSDTTMAFISTIQQDGNQWKIVIDEYYKHLEYPVEIFDKYKQVINAAADFNKVVLILQKREG